MEVFKKMLSLIPTTKHKNQPRPLSI